MNYTTYNANRPVEAHPAVINKVTFFGCSSAIPVPHKCNVSALVVSLSNGSNILVDCGEATQHQLMLSQNTKMSSIDLILITHLHGDHFFGLFGLLASLGTGLNRSTPLTVIGPKGLKAAIAHVFNAEYNEIPSHPFSGESEVAQKDLELQSPEESPSSPKGEHGYKLNIIELDTTQPTLIMSPNHGGGDDHEPPCEHMISSPIGIDIVAVPIVHRVPCVGYVIHEHSKQGALDAKKAITMGVKTSDLAKLKAGQDIDVISPILSADGGKTGENIITKVIAKECVGEPKQGKSIAIVQDTHDPTRFQDCFYGVNTMIHECTYDDELFSKAVAHSHSTSSMAAAFAYHNNVQNLILTHFSSRYEKEYPYVLLNNTTIDKNTNNTLKTAFHIPENNRKIAKDFDFTTLPLLDQDGAPAVIKCYSDLLETDPSPLLQSTSNTYPFTQFNPLLYPNSILAMDKSLSVEISPESENVNAKARSSRHLRDRVSTFDIRDQAQYCVEQLNMMGIALGNHHAKDMSVFVAADFRMFEFVSKGATTLKQLPHPDIDLTDLVRIPMSGIKFSDE